MLSLRGCCPEERRVSIDFNSLVFLLILSFLLAGAGALSLTSDRSSELGSSPVSFSFSAVQAPSSPSSPSAHSSSPFLTPLAPQYRLCSRPMQCPNAPRKEQKRRYDECRPTNLRHLFRSLDADMVSTQGLREGQIIAHSHRHREKLRQRGMWATTGQREAVAKGAICHSFLSLRMAVLVLILHIALVAHCHGLSPHRIALSASLLSSVSADQPAGDECNQQGSFHAMCCLLTEHQCRQRNCGMQHIEHRHALWTEEQCEAAD